MHFQFFWGLPLKVDMIVDATTSAVAFLFLVGVATLFIATAGATRRRRRRLAELEGGRAGKVDVSKLAAKKTLITETECRFFDFLRECIEDEYHISCQVRLADLLVFPRSNKFALLNRTAMKHIDFVLCEPRSMTVIAAIELDDRSHENPERMERDKFIDAVMEATKIPFIRVKPKAHYDAQQFLVDLRLAVRTNDTAKDVTSRIIEKIRETIPSPRLASQKA